MTGKLGFVLLGVVLLVIAGACDGEGPSPATPTSPVGETPTVTPEVSPTPTVAATQTPVPTPTSTPTPTPFEGTRDPVEGEGMLVGAGPALLVQVRTGRHDGFDRIVFQFEDGVPGHRIEYVQPPILGEFSGEQVEVAGNAFLKVRFSTAAGYDPFTGERTYHGPLERVIGLPSLLEAEVTGDFEGILTWVLGLGQEVDFRVFVLEEPFVVVIDVAHV